MFLISAFGKGQSWLTCESLRPEPASTWAAAETVWPQGSARARAEGQGGSRAERWQMAAALLVPRHRVPPAVALEHMWLIRASRGGSEMAGLFPWDLWTWATWEKSVLRQHRALLPSKIPRGLSAWGRPSLSRSLGRAPACPPQSLRHATFHHVHLKHRSATLVT